MITVGEALVAELKTRGVDVIFGIPGVHTIELYRGLQNSGIRHVTPRHEQGAGFMADGYARVSGKPGVAFVITGPGLTNILTPMAQARADSVPLLVVSSVNASDTLGRGLGHLHELPAQQDLAAQVALTTVQITKDTDLSVVLDQVFKDFQTKRPGPAHVEIPLDILGTPYLGPRAHHTNLVYPPVKPQDVDTVCELMAEAKAPVILAGGGARWVAKPLETLAERLDAPVVQTVNARGLLYKHPLGIPASPSLKAVRNLMRDADLLIALGTEFGPTDYDMYQNHKVPKLTNLIRVDICAHQLKRHKASHAIQARCEDVLPLWLEQLGLQKADCSGFERAQKTRLSAMREIGPVMRKQVKTLNTLRNAIPDALIVGDSTQLIYAGNLYYDHDRAGGWFNASTGYGALGYAIPAAIGAALANPAAQVICLIGDGGAQFTLSELMVAVQENLPIIFVIWNNYGYQEIATSMTEVGVETIGCDPAPPDFRYIAKACGIPFQSCSHKKSSVMQALNRCKQIKGPYMIEIQLELPETYN